MEKSDLGVKGKELQVFGGVRIDFGHNSLLTPSSK